MVEAYRSDVDEIEEQGYQREDHDDPECDLQVILDVGLDVDCGKEEGRVEEGEYPVESEGREPSILDVLAEQDQGNQGEHLGEDEGSLGEIDHIVVLSLLIFTCSVDQIGHPELSFLLYSLACGPLLILGELDEVLFSKFFRAIFNLFNVFLLCFGGVQRKGSADTGGLKFDGDEVVLVVLGAKGEGVGVIVDWEDE